MGPLHGIDDDAAERVAARGLWERYALRPTYGGGTCPCGLVDTLLVSGRCLRCTEDREWAQANRLFCDLIHRGETH